MINHGEIQEMAIQGYILVTPLHEYENCVQMAQALYCRARGWSE